MPAVPTWALAHPETFASLLASPGLAEFQEACLQAAAPLLGPGALRESLFWIPSPGPSPGDCSGGWLLDPHSLSTGRYALPRVPREELRAVALGREPSALLPFAPLAGFEPCAGPWTMPGDGALATLAIRLTEGVAAPGACAPLWLLGLSSAPEALEADTLEEAARLGTIIGLLLPRLTLADQAQRESRLLWRVQEAMLPVLLEMDAHSMLAELLAVLGREFGLRRICILLVHPESHTLRGELHTGFGAHFTAPSLPLDQAAHPFIRALHHPAGAILLHEGGHTGLANPADPAAQPDHPDWLIADEGEAPARAVLLPLQLPQRRVGLIYADQPVHDGSPFFRAAFELFARLASVAIHHQQQHGRAELRAETDPLTGLRNRYFLDKILEIEVPRVKRYNTPISLLMIDLLDFKHINDHYGHPFGDFILRETANLLLSSVRRGDVVIRYGGDEFIVLMVNTGPDQAELVRKRVERSFIERNRMQTVESMAIHISLGLRSAGADDIDRLLHEADMAMYAHKSRQTRRHLLEALVAGDLDRIEAVDRMVAHLCTILYKKEPRYRDHARRVAHLALRLAVRLDFSAEDLETLALAALLHDVGKIWMPTETLQKKGALSDEERRAMRHHPAAGEELFQGVAYLEGIRPPIRHHHERFDGSMESSCPAYPDGLHGERLPLASRILRLAESVDGMLSDRPYRPGLSREAVLEILKEESGKSFDPRLVRQLLADTEHLAQLGNADELLELIREDHF